MSPKLNSIRASRIALLISQKRSAFRTRPFGFGRLRSHFRTSFWLWNFAIRFPNTVWVREVLCGIPLRSLGKYCIISGIFRRHNYTHVTTDAKNSDYKRRLGCQYAMFDLLVTFDSVSSFQLSWKWKPVERRQPNARGEFIVAIVFHWQKKHLYWYEHWCQICYGF